MARAAANAGGSKMISTDVVAVLLMATNNTTISKVQLDMMSALDGTRTASSFEHQFRDITAKAKEMKACVEKGENFEPVRPARKRGPGDKNSATPKKRKTASSDNEPTPIRKKATTKPRVQKKQPAQDEFDGGSMDDFECEGFPADASDFIKGEQDWEHDFA